MRGLGDEEVVGEYCVSQLATDVESLLDGSPTVSRTPVEVSWRYRGGGRNVASVIDICIQELERGCAKARRGNLKMASYCELGGGEEACEAPGFSRECRIERREEIRESAPEERDLLALPKTLVDIFKGRKDGVIPRSTVHRVRKLEEKSADVGVLEAMANEDERTFEGEVPEMIEKAAPADPVENVLVGSKNKRAVNIRGSGDTTVKLQ
jgi:hypothetical protein